jgi:hypothetical protein
MAFTAGTPIYVVAATIPAARAALTTAATMAQALDSRMHVIAAGPRYGEPGQFAHEILRQREATSTRVDVLPCACRRLLDVVQLLAPGSIVVVGGRSRWLWPTAEQRLAYALTARGCRVVFVSPVADEMAPIDALSRAHVHVGESR